MTATIYAAILALWICWLAINVVKARRKHQVKYGDGGVNPLIIARSAHSNATETIPIALILLFALEFNGAANWMIHLLGICFVIGRVMHGKAILADNVSNRVKGMKITVFSIICLVVTNMLLLPYGSILSLT